MIESCTALGLLFLLATASGVVPFLGIEAVLVAFVLLDPTGTPWWLAALAAAAGQLLGKAAHVLGARRVGQVPAVHRRLARGVELCRSRPGSAAGVVLLSATAGLPPFTAVVPAMALSGIDLRRLVPVAVVGRTARFLLIAGVPELASRLW